jgi:L-methionine (R)-S-oxide reductase
MAGSLATTEKETSAGMPNHEFLLHEFEAHTSTADGLKSFMQHVAQRLHEELTRYNWVGFYFMEAPAFNALILGPYAGSFVPLVRIPLDKGLCGAAATTQQTVCVNNVASDSRYIGGDMVKSNIVVPIFVKKRVAAELCIESYFAGAFDAAEQKFIESCAALVGRYMEKEASEAAKKASASY